MSGSRRISSAWWSSWPIAPISPGRSRRVLIRTRRMRWAPASRRLCARHGLAPRPHRPAGRRRCRWWHRSPRQGRESRGYRRCVRDELCDQWILSTDARHGRRALRVGGGGSQCDQDEQHGMSCGRLAATVRVEPRRSRSGEPTAPARVGRLSVPRPKHSPDGSTVVPTSPQSE